MNWYKQAQSTNISIEKWQKSIQDTLDHLVDFSARKDDKGYPYTQEMAVDDMARMSQQTTANMQKIAQNIQEAISRISNWSQSSIFVEARTYDKNNEIDAETDAEVFVGKSTSWGGSPSFTYFSEDTIIIEDVLSAGDTDFFSDSATESDYFLLVQELKNPGASSNPGKILTLYTARPTADRQIYENATTLPHGIYLTNNMDRVSGIAMDLGGSQGMRDIWQVKIDERYLMQTLDAMGSKDYQVVGEEAPVQSIYLVQGD